MAVSTLAPGLIAARTVMADPTNRVGRITHETHRPYIDGFMPEQKRSALLYKAAAPALLLYA